MFSSIVNGGVYVTGHNQITQITVTDTGRNREYDSDIEEGDEHRLLQQTPQDSLSGIRFLPIVKNLWMEFTGLRALHVDMHKLFTHRWNPDETECGVSFVSPRETPASMFLAAIYKAPQLQEFVGYFSRIHHLIKLTDKLSDALLESKHLSTFRLLRTHRHVKTKKVFLPLFRRLPDALFCVTNVVTQNVSNLGREHHGIYYPRNSWRALVGCGRLTELRIEITGCTQNRSRVYSTGLCILPSDDLMWIDNGTAAQPSSQPIPACVQAKYLSIGTLTIPGGGTNTWPEDYMKKVLMSIFKNPNNKFLSFALLSGSFCGNGLCVRPENDGHFHIPSIDTIELPSRTVLIHVFGMRRDIHSRAINSVTNDLHNFINKCDTLLMTFTSPKPDPDRPDYPGQ